MKRSIKYENAEGNQNDREVLYCTRSNESILRLARITNKVVMCTKCKSLLNVEETWSEFEDMLVSSATSDVSMSSNDLLVTLKAKHAYVSQLNAAGEGIWKVGDTLYITGNNKCLTPPVQAEINCSLISGKFDVRVRKKVLSILRDAAKDSLIGISSVSRCETLSDESDDLESVSSLAPAERRMLQHALVEGAPLAKKARYSLESPDASKPLTSTAKQSPRNTTAMTVASSTSTADNSTASTLLGSSSSKAPVANAASASRFPLPVVRTTTSTTNTTLTTTMTSSFSTINTTRPATLSLTPTTSASKGGWSCNADTGLIGSTSVTPLVTAPTTPATQGTVYRDSFSARPPAPTVSGVFSEECGASASSDKFTAFLDILRKNAPPDIHSLHLPSLPSITPAGCTEQAVTELNVSTSKTPLAPTTPQHNDSPTLSDDHLYSRCSSGEDSSLCTVESPFPSLTSSRHKLSCHSSSSLSSSSEEDTAGRGLLGRSTHPTPTTIFNTSSTNTTSTSTGPMFGMYVPPTLRKEANKDVALPFANSVPPRATHTFAKATPLGSDYTILPACTSSTSKGPLPAVNSVAVEHRDTFPVWPPPSAISSAASEGCRVRASSKQFAAAFLDILRKNAPPDIHPSHPPPLPSITPVAPRRLQAPPVGCAEQAKEEHEVVDPVGSAERTTVTPAADVNTSTTHLSSRRGVGFVDSLQTRPSLSFPSVPLPLPCSMPTHRLPQAPPSVRCTEEAVEVRGKSHVAGVDLTGAFPIWPRAPAVSIAVSAKSGINGESKIQTTDLHSLPLPPPPVLYVEHHLLTGIDLHADSVQTLRNLSNFFDGRICRDTQRNLKEKTHTMPIHVYRGAYSLPRGQWTGVVLDLSRYSLMDESLFITLWNTEISNAMDRLKVNAFTRFKL